MIDFDTFQERVTMGTVGACYVQYKVEILNASTGDVVKHMSVSGERDVLTDFNAASSTEAILPIIDAIENKLTWDQEVGCVELRFILVRLNNESGSNTFISFMPDGRSSIIEISTKEVFEDLLETLLG